MLIGRNKEKAILQEALDKEESQFIAVYGRRRVGKTYLIRESYGADFVQTTIGEVCARVAGTGVEGCSNRN